MTRKPLLMVFPLVAAPLGCTPRDMIARDDVVASDTRPADVDAPDVGTHDAPNADDLGADASDAAGADATDAADADASLDPTIAAPRPLSPLSTATASRQPTLRWALPAGVTGAAVELCAARSCATVTQRFEADGASGRPPRALAPGVHFWRVRGRAEGRVGVATSAVWELFVRRSAADADTSWGTTADFNGDGRADFVVGGAVSASPDGTVTSPSLLAYHGPVGPDARPALRLSEPAVVRALTNAGDVNGDGFGDLLVAGFTGTSPDGARVTLLLGGPDGLRAPPVEVARGVTVPQGNELFAGPAPRAASAGDLNGDGYGDVALLVTPEATTGPGLQVALVFGGPAALTLARTSLRAVAVATGWDADGDGYADLALGVPTADSFGAVQVYAGGGEGLATTPRLTRAGSAALGQNFGASLALVGDVNGDGRADLAVSATIPHTTMLETGTWRRLHVFHGTADGLAAEPAASAQGLNRAFPFAIVVAAAGDVNGDGFDDVAARDPLGSSDDGAARVFLGAAAGLQTEASRQVQSLCEDGAFGYAIAGAGDLDGDGFGDLLVGQPGRGQTSACAGGRVHVFAGGAAGVGAAPAVTLRGPDNPVRPAAYGADRFGDALAAAR